MTKNSDGTASTTRRLLSGRVLANNTLWNFAGMAAPMLVAIFAVPVLIAGMGTERFGLLGIIWMGIGYFSLFDMGLGQALTKLVAERLGRGGSDDLDDVIWTALWLICGLGVVGMLVGMLLADPLVYRLLNVPAELRGEAVIGFRLLAGSIPVVIATSALIGILAAYQRFAMIAAVRLPLGVMTFAGPLISLHFSPSLVGATLSMVATRAVAFIIYYACATRVSASLRQPKSITRIHVRSLLSFGGWLTVSNIVGPLMVYVDRFFVGAVLNMTAVAHYVTPYDMLSRTQVLPQAVVGVLFPALTSVSERERSRLPKLYSQSVWILSALMLPLMGGVFLFAPEGLQLWLGTDFRIAATPAVRWIALGWMINNFARIPFTLLQSVGRPDLMGKTHIAEIVPYGLALWALTIHYGIAGTAAAWFLRVLVDTIIVNELVRWKLTDIRATIMWTYKILAGVLAVAVISWFIDSVSIRIILLCALMAASTVILYPYVSSWRQAHRDDGEISQKPMT